MKGHADQLPDDYSEELTRWLEDSGRRPAMRQQESPEKLIEYLEHLAGAPMRSTQDITLWLGKLKAETDERERRHAQRHLFRELSFVVALLFAVLQYYFWDVNLQIARLKTNHYFIAATGARLPRRGHRSTAGGPL